MPEALCLHQHVLRAPGDRTLGPEPGGTDPLLQEQYQGGRPVHIFVITEFIFNLHRYLF